MRFPLAAVTAAAVAVLAAGLDPGPWQARAQERAQVQERAQERVRGREIIPGSELMTPQEREDYRARYAAAKTDAERGKVRADHVRAMEERARLLGLRLADPVAPGGAAP